MIRSVLAAAGLLLALAGISVFVALGYTAWVVRSEADRQLAAARTEAALHPQKENVNPLVRMVVRDQARNLPGKVEQARDAVGTASDAVVVASAALDVFAQLHVDGEALGVGPERVQAARGQLDQVAAELKSARLVLGVPVPRPDGPATDEQLSAVDDALSRARGVTDDLERVLGRVRVRVAEVRATAELWAWRAAVVVTALAALAALGQVFMARACWRALRRREW